MTTGAAGDEPRMTAIYAGVIVVEVFVIALLWAMGRYFG
jgi:hypothetical protein